MDKVPIDEENALRIRIELVIDRTTGNCRWTTHGMASAYDLREQHLIGQAMHLMLKASYDDPRNGSDVVN